MHPFSFRLCPEVRSRRKRPSSLLPSHGIYLPWRATDSCLVRADALIHASARVRFNPTSTRLSVSEGTYWSVTCSSCVAARVG
jgi:hypothetical protein